MAKGTKKNRKNKKADVNQAVTSMDEVFNEAPVGIDWNVGVDPALVAASYATEEVVDGGNGSAEKELEIPIGGFNRNGMDAMMEGEILVIDSSKPEKKSRLVYGTGFRGTAWKILTEGGSGEDVIKAISEIYKGKGKDEEYGKARGKRILTDVQRMMGRGYY